MSRSVIDRSALGELMSTEEQRFVDLHPRSAELAESGRRHLLAGVPMPWMTRWPGAFAIHVAEAAGARFIDVDGIEYVDFCLGDTGAMTGHGTIGLASIAGRSTTMLPSEDAAWVADELARRFGMAKWQLTTSATDANRFVLRFARHLTGRPKIAVMDWCYHGTVDETLAILGPGGEVVSRPGAIGPQVDPATTTRVVPFNDLDALDAALAHGDVAALLMEPALTNIGIVLPHAGYHEAVRAITRRHGALLIIDETHTISAGPGGCTEAWGLEPDIVVIGKPIGGGFPVATYGVTDEIAIALDPALHGHDADVGGVGGTLAGSAMATAAIRATLSTTLLEADYARMVPLAARWTDGVAEAIERFDVPWSVQQLGCRAEYWFCPLPANGADAAAAVDDQLDAFMHLWALNRGILMTPFHNMALLSPAHDEADVDRHTDVFTAALDALME
ncbi:MAG TPA: transaminase [Ilumatobacteraceae bacterium]|nr:transaminase [Ilumatobacteraceae bacterium]